MHEAELERAELTDLLADLRPDEWRRPSLCAGWTVRDVVAHLLSYEGLGPREVVGRMVRGRLVLGRINDVALRAQDAAGPQELVERLRAYPRPTGLTAVRGGAVGLVDALIHQQDIRRPLARPRTLDPARVRFALGFTLTAPPLRGFWKARGVRLVATDVDWATGRGPEARGPGEAVLMALAGRRGAAADLTGPGSVVLQQRHG
ncbi:maleylpyruvate isomerase family mycothiol-dependent enzyme [Nocardioides sp. SOB77]|uniref:Maleylpyruvate isomerase family mycothiol-dependent enzyme n=1 Tax=Nocardioides oceani TaxID=3058369 RepID=A0ABT8FLN8_9ACTN|nr:maleylpyruvate isomerase family mycothiol-dependent enzyme [Nocardioides oceani]MDN4175449.1 maleylpyruvate isomerase family mycothiol-dependent enzyme [Nocardioides oceani]